MAGIFPQFAATAATFSRASNLITRVGSDAHLYDDPQDVNIASLLDSKYDVEKAQGMKRLIALMSQGIDVANYFPQVVKNIVSPSLEVKKLVYIYLVHFAEKRPDEALLSINSFQKDLSDINPLVRAWALRAMSGIRVRVVLPLVVMAVNKAARDPSPYVRRCAAHALPKIFSLDHEQHVDALEELVSLLLNDSSSAVLGAAAAAFIAVCPEKLHIVGPVFRKLCEMLPDVDEWGQVVLMDILTYFAVGKYGAPRNSVGLLSLNRMSSQYNLEGKFGAASKDDSWAVKDRRTGIGQDHIPLSDLPEFFADSETTEIAVNLRLLLKCASPLLWSQNSAVVMAATVIHWLFAPKDSLPKITKPLLFLLRSSFDTQYVVLSNITTFVGVSPDLFEDFYEDFFVRPSDNLAIRAIKLDILTQISTESSIHAILEEFQAYVRDPVRQFAADTVSAIGRCAVRLPSVASACMDGLFRIVQNSLESSCWQDENLKEVICSAQEFCDAQTKNSGTLGGKLSDNEAVVVTQAVIAIRLIIQQLPSEEEAGFCRLVRSLDQMKVPSARAIIIWMLGEYSLPGSAILQIVPVVMSYLGGTFTKEADETKLQILNCAVKVVVRFKRDPDCLSLDRVKLVLKYVLNLGSYDLNCDIRDRARMFLKLLAPELEPIRSLPEAPCAVATTDIGTPGQSTQFPPLDEGGEKREKCRSHPSTCGPKAPVVLLGNLVEKLLLVPRFAPALPSLGPDRSSFVPGTMSHIVQHKAPGYRLLPEPGSFQDVEQSPTRIRLPSTAGRKSGYADGKSADSHQQSDSNSEEGGSTDIDSSESSGSYTDGFSAHGNGRMHSSSNKSSSSEDRQSVEKRQSSSDYHVTSGSRAAGSQYGVAPSGTATTAIEELGRYGPLISMSDSEAGPTHDQLATSSSGSKSSQLDAGGRGTGQGILSAIELESWLGPPLGAEESKLLLPTGMTQNLGEATSSFGTIAVEPKKYVLLDFTNGGGLEVKYSFSWTPSLYSQRMVCVRLYLHNRSLQSKFIISVKAANVAAPFDGKAKIGSTAMSAPDSAADEPVIVPLEEFPEIGPGQKLEGNLHVDFRHKLNPAKLLIVCDGSEFPVKLAPEVGALLRPSAMTTDMFVSTELRLSGMFESSRRCFLREPFLASLSMDSLPSPTLEERPAQISRTIMCRVFECARVSLVSAALPSLDQTSGVDARRAHLQSLSLRFSGETLTGSLVCLITVAISVNEFSVNESETITTTVKVNCEDTVFGLTLLKQLDKVLSLS